MNLLKENKRLSLRKDQLEYTFLCKRIRDKLFINDEFKDLEIKIENINLPTEIILKYKEVVNITILTINKLRKIY